MYSEWFYISIKSTRQKSKSECGGFEWTHWYNWINRYWSETWIDQCIE